MLELSREIAERGRLRRHLHVSTAYVAGRFRGRFLETDLDVGQGFRNTYEQSKFEAERAIGEARRRAAAGDRAAEHHRRRQRARGWTSAFNVIYWPMRAFSRGLMDEIAIDPDGVVDIVPVDYVGARRARAAATTARASGTVALVAGESAPTNAELIELACRQFGREPPRIVADAGLAARGRRALRALLRHRGEPRRHARARAARAARARRCRRCATTSRR